jgi:hypothetical protein
MPLYGPAAAYFSMCVLLACALALAADDPSVDPCTLLTKAEVEHIIGKVKGTPASGQEERAAYCVYQFANGMDALELWVFPASGLERAKESIKTRSPVIGLGQEAFITRNEDIPYIDLFLRKGNVTLEVTMKESPGDEEKVKAIAKKALSRLSSR